MGTMVRHLLPFFCVCSILMLYTDVVLVMEKEPNPALAISASTGLCVDNAILFLHLSALEPGEVLVRPHGMVSGARALLLVVIPYRVTLIVVSPRVPKAWVIVAFAASATVSLVARSAVASRQLLWWSVLGSPSFFFGWLDLLRCAWDGADALRHLTLTGGTGVDMLMALLYADRVRGGAIEGASSGRRELVAVALSYRAAVLVSPPPLLVAAAFATMVGLCVLSILSAELG